MRGTIHLEIRGHVQGYRRIARLHEIRHIRHKINQIRLKETPQAQTYPSLESIPEICVEDGGRSLSIVAKCIIVEDKKSAEGKG
jgi:hypothetical protein